MGMELDSRPGTKVSGTHDANDHSRIRSHIVLCQGDKLGIRWVYVVQHTDHCQVDRYICNEWTDGRTCSTPLKVIKADQ